MRPMRQLNNIFGAIAIGFISVSGFAAARDEALLGTWVAVHDIRGVVLPHFEVLRVEPGNEVTIEIYALRLGERCDKPTQLTPPECRNPSVYARGKFVRDPIRSTISLTQVRKNQIRIEGWQASDLLLAPKLYWFGTQGAMWNHRLTGDRLVAEQSVSLPASTLGEPGNGQVRVRVSKTLFRTDSDFPADLLDLLGELDLSIIEGYCILEAIGDSRAEFPKFREFLATTAKVARAIKTLDREMRTVEPSKSRTDSRVSAYQWVANAKPGTSAPNNVETALGTSAADIAVFVRTRFDVNDKARAPAYVFPGLELRAESIGACRKRIRV